MRILRRIAAVVVALVLATGGVAVVAPASASAGTGGCYGSGCNGLDPMGRCDGDAITVRAMDVGDGMLELRYSRSCVANWGRYTPYRRTVTNLAMLNPSVGIWARVTVWNPGKPSYGTAHHAGLNIYESTWSFMTDGRPVACTGVEQVYVRQDSENESLGWRWGPCY